MVKPVKFAHIVYMTPRFGEMLRTIEDSAAQALRCAADPR